MERGAGKLRGLAAYADFTFSAITGKRIHCDPNVSRA
jgi:hypothetical protein